MTIEEVLANEERQIFDRKSINIEPKALAVPLIAFANADGGTIAIGISDKTRRIEGTDFEIQKLNELLRVPYDFCEPSVPVQIDADVHSIRVAARAATSDAAYKLADDMWHALLADTETDAGFIQLDDTYAQVALYDKPLWNTQDQQGRKVFDFTAKLITKRL